jgi:hypothetical protein
VGAQINHNSLYGIGHHARAQRPPPPCVVCECEVCALGRSGRVAVPGLPRASARGAVRPGMCDLARQDFFLSNIEPRRPAWFWGTQPAWQQRTEVRGVWTRSTPSDFHAFAKAHICRRFRGRG